MTKIRAYKPQDAGGEYCIEAQGHATGSEQVCAAVSILMYTLAEYAERHGTIIECRLDEADARVRWTGAGAAYEVVMTGFELLEHSFPKFLEILR